MSEPNTHPDYGSSQEQNQYVDDDQGINSDPSTQTQNGVQGLQYTDVGTSYRLTNGRAIVLHNEYFEQQFISREEYVQKLNKMTLEEKQDPEVQKKILFHDRRVGNEEDVKRIFKQLTMMNFDVEEKPNLTAKEMSEVLTAESRNENLKNMDCFICVIMTHGGRGDTIDGTDNNHLFIKQILDMFNIKKCPDLKGKPKIFIIQACRGRQEDQPRRDPASVYYCSDSSEATLPISSDVLVAYACEEEYSSNRYPDGTWFIQAICKAFEENWKTMSLLSMLTIAINDVAQKLEPHPEFVVKQGVNFRSSLRKEIFFNTLKNVSLKKGGK